MTMINSFYNSEIVDNFWYEISQIKIKLYLVSEEELLIRNNSENNNYDIIFTKNDNMFLIELFKYNDEYDKKTNEVITIYENEIIYKPLLNFLKNARNNEFKNIATGVQIESDENEDVLNIYRASEKSIVLMGNKYAEIEINGKNKQNKKQYLNTFELLFNDLKTKANQLPKTEEILNTKMYEKLNKKLF